MMRDFLPDSGMIEVEHFKLKNNDQAPQPTEGKV
jgi:hypothetical protein